MQILRILLLSKESLVSVVRSVIQKDVAHFSKKTKETIVKTSEETLYVKEGI